MIKESYYKAAIIILLILLIAVIIHNQMMGIKENGDDKMDDFSRNTSEEQKTQQKSESEILKKLKQFPELKPYENHTIGITLLTEENLTELSKQQPVIYKDIKPGTYRIVFKSNGGGLLVIYDPDENKILKEFELKNIKL